MLDVLKLFLLELFVVAIIIFLISISGCSNLPRIEKHSGWMSPDVWELTDGNISVKYYNGDCCCIAEEVLEDILFRIEYDELDWYSFSNKQFADSILEETCKELKLLEQ